MRGVADPLVASSTVPSCRLSVQDHHRRAVVSCLVLLRRLHVPFRVGGIVQPPVGHRRDSHDCPQTRLRQPRDFLPLAPPLRLQPRTTRDPATQIPTIGPPPQRRSLCVNEAARSNLIDCLLQGEGLPVAQSLVGVVSLKPQGFTPRPHWIHSDDDELVRGREMGMPGCPLREVVGGGSGKLSPRSPIDVEEDGKLLGCGCSLSLLPPISAPGCMLEVGEVEFLLRVESRLGIWEGGEAGGEDDQSVHGGHPLVRTRLDCKEAPRRKVELFHLLCPLFVRLQNFHFLHHHFPPLIDDLKHS
mmetsp:Transcript_16285/g.33031  ORF Transcript_16285/g.33031 Transcript_16285/m.33031 type:complete len:301 (-) Transcript_16285:1754-2656(-)